MKLAKDQIARQFSRAASTYDQAAQLQTKMATRLIDAIPAEAAGALVELGCGTGWALNEIEQTGRFTLTAVDLAPGMIEIARSRVPAATFHCCDLEKTPLDNNSADVVFSNAAIQWCDAAEAFREMQRICKPRGHIFVSTFGPSTFHELRSAWRDASDTNNRVHEFESTQQIESAMLELGLQNVSVETTDEVIQFDSVDGLLQSIKQLGATNASTKRQTGLLGTKRYRKFRQVFDQRLTDDGHLTLTFESVFAFAQKH